MPNGLEASLPVRKSWLCDVCLQVAASRGTKPKHTFSSEEIALPDADLYCIVAGWQVDPTPGGTGIPVGGVAQGLPVKSKKSSRLG
jgi:hypothetical protein